MKEEEAERIVCSQHLDFGLFFMSPKTVLVKQAVTISYLSAFFPLA